MKQLEIQETIVMKDKINPRQQTLREKVIALSLKRTKPPKNRGNPRHKTKTIPQFETHQDYYESSR